MSVLPTLTAVMSTPCAITPMDRTPVHVILDIQATEKHVPVSYL